MKRRHEEAMDDENGTIQLNIVGTMYEVSKSLLSKHPDTWKKADDSAPIFIERDSNKFRYVLEYMRDGRVSLPACQGGITKSSLYKELQYYGFLVDDNKIRTEAALLDAPKYMAQLTEKYEAERKEMEKQREKLEIDIPCAVAAHAIAIRRMSSGSEEIAFSIVNIVADEILYHSRAELVERRSTNNLDHDVMDALHKKSLSYECRGGKNYLINDLNKALAKYGLGASDYQEKKYDIYRSNQTSRYEIGEVSAKVTSTIIF